MLPGYHPCQVTELLHYVAGADAIAEREALIDETLSELAGELCLTLTLAPALTLTLTLVQTLTPTLSLTLTLTLTPTLALTLTLTPTLSLPLTRRVRPQY